MNDKTASIQELKNLVEKFRIERNWDKYHSPRNLAVSILIEAAELLEHFQWGNDSKGDRADLAAELADVIMYSLFFALANKIDVSKAIEAKIAHLSKKYPVDVFGEKADGLKDYWRIKKSYRKTKQ